MSSKREPPGSSCYIGQRILILTPLVVVRTRGRLRAIENENHENIHAWVSFSFFYEYGAPLCGPSRCRSTMIIENYPDIASVIFHNATQMCR